MKRDPSTAALPAAARAPDSGAPWASPARPAGRLAKVLLAAAYPLLAHAATVAASPRLTLASVVALLAAVTLPGLVARRPIAWVGTGAAVVGIVVLARLDTVAMVLFLPPVLINFFLAWMFGRTLGRDRMPLIEQLVRLLHPPEEALDAGIPRYAALLTATWTALFLVLGTVNLLLALLATPGGVLDSMGLHLPLAVSIETWSLFANVWNYVVVGMFFIGEWIYRRRRFPQQPYRNLFDFMRHAAAAVPALVAGARPHQPDSTP